MNPWDCTPYPHYLDFLMPFILGSAVVGWPLAAFVVCIYLSSRKYD